MHLFQKLVQKHCVKSVRIQNSFGPRFLAFGLNTEKYLVQMRENAGPE